MTFPRLRRQFDSGIPLMARVFPPAPERSEVCWSNPPNPPAGGEGGRFPSLALLKFSCGTKVEAGVLRLRRTGILLTRSGHGFLARRTSYSKAGGDSCYPLPKRTKRFFKRIWRACAHQFAKEKCPLLFGFARARLILQMKGHFFWCSARKDIRAVWRGFNSDELLRKLFFGERISQKLD